MGNAWEVHHITTSDPEKLRKTLPKGLKGVVCGRDIKYLEVKVPETPHKLHDAFFKWGVEHSITEGFSCLL